MTTVIALGGNYISDKRALKKAVESISRQFNQVIITHGNGPQVGSIIDKMGCSLSKAVAITQASIGQSIIQELENRTRNKSIVMLTRTLVKKEDPAFKNPSKPIGEYKEKKFKNAKYFPGRGWRRVVPSPAPVKILESAAVQQLYLSGHNIVCCGGGGIPVVKEKREYEEVNAVVDKDMASATLAGQLHAEKLVILMKEPCVYADYGLKTQERINSLTASQALKLLKRKRLEEGTIAPKVKAGALFARAGGTTIITNASELQKAMKGKGGTVICR